MRWMQDWNPGSGKFSPVMNQPELMCGMYNFFVLVGEEFKGWLTTLMLEKECLQNCKTIPCIIISLRLILVAHLAIEWIDGMERLATISTPSN
jgi:hypothetical protein